MKKRVFDLVEGFEFSPEQLPPKLMTTIVSVLAEKGETRNVGKIWWSKEKNFIVVLMDTPDNETCVSYPVLLSTIVKRQ